MATQPGPVLARHRRIGRRPMTSDGVACHLVGALAGCGYSRGADGRLRLGVLAEVFTPELVDAVIGRLANYVKIRQLARTVTAACVHGSLRASGCVLAGHGRSAHRIWRGLFAIDGESVVGMSSSAFQLAGFATCGARLAARGS
jgi:hypothetical protein